MNRIAIAAAVLALTLSPALANNKKGQGGQANSTKVVVNSGNSNYITNGANAQNFNLNLGINKGGTSKKGWSW